MLTKGQSISLKLVVIILTAVVIFHFLIFINLIPAHIIWGGNITSKTQFYVLEMVSIVVNLLIMMALLIKAKYLNINISEKIINFSLWFFAGYFLLNTLANLMANTNLEKSFSGLTLLLAILMINLLIKKKV